MALLRLSVGLIAMLALGGVAGGASAQTVRQNDPPSVEASDAYTLNQSQQPQVIELDSKRRWGLKLEIRRPVTRQTELRDVEAGAFYKLTPSLRVGGAVGATDAEAPTEDQATPHRTTPRVRLGAAFKF